MSERKDLKIDIECIEMLDKMIERYGGTYDDWVVLSIINGLWEGGYYGKAFELFDKVEFDTSEVLNEARNNFQKWLSDLEKP